MNRKNFIKYLYENKCVFLKEGAKHSVFFNPLSGRSSTVPRHNELDSNLAKKICTDLGIKKINKR
jgi:hypothetical protein